MTDLQCLCEKRPGECEFYLLPNGYSTAHYLGHRGAVEALDAALRRRDALTRLIEVTDEGEDG